MLAESKSDEVEISTTLQLGCQSRGYPPITSYNWTKDGVQLALNESEYVILFVQVLRLVLFIYNTKDLPCLRTIENVDHISTFS